MDTQSLLAEVDRRFSEECVEVILKKLKHNHANSDWKLCDCSYCSLKREATDVIGSPSKHGSIFRMFDSETFEPMLKYSSPKLKDNEILLTLDYDSTTKFSNLIRSRIKQEYSKKLNNLMDQ